jgi:hypothetical protein
MDQAIRDIIRYQMNVIEDLIDAIDRDVKESEDQKIIDIPITKKNTLDDLRCNRIKQRLETIEDKAQTLREFL